MSSFGGSVKLTGESEYQKALKEITGNLKLLGSEMKFTTSLYDQNDKSAENLSARNEILTKQVGEQEKKVSILKDALEQAKKETGENSETTNKWQIKLNEAQAELNKLNREVDSNYKAMQEATDGTKEEADAVEDFGKEAEKSGEKALSLGDIIKANLISDAIKAGLSALADGVKAVGGAMKESITAGAAYADTFLTMSVQTGISTENLQKYNAVAELVDVSTETLTNSMAKNIKSMSSVQNISAEASVDMQKLAKAQTNVELATNGVEKAQINYTEAVKKYGEGSAQAKKSALDLENAQIKLASAQEAVAVASQAVEPQMNEMTKAYAKLGVSVYDAQGNLRDGETVYWETIDALGKITDETERDSIAMQILGKSAQDLNPLIAQGSEGVKAMGDEAVKMGAVLSEDALSALGAVDDEMQKFGTITSSTGNLLASAFAPAVSSVMGGVNGLGQSFNGLISAVLSGDEGGIQTFTDEVTYAITDLVDNLSFAIASIEEVAPQLINTLLSVIEKNLPFVLESGLALLSTLLSGISSNLDSILPVILSVVEFLLETILSNLPLILEMGIQVLTSLLSGISSMLPKLIPLAISAILNLCETLLDNIDLIIDAGILLIMSLVDGLLSALPDLIDKAPVILNKLISAISSNLPKIIEMGVELTVQLIGGLIKATPQLVVAGGQMLAGLFKGLLNPQTIANSVKSLFNGIVGGIKSIFGIHSPSTVFRDAVGHNLALGLGEGFTDTMEDVTREMGDAIPTEFDTDIGANMSVASGSSRTNTYDMMVSAFKQALTDVKVVMDGREMGGFVVKTVERVVFA